MRTEIETAGSGKGLGSILRFKYRTSPQQGDNLRQVSRGIAESVAALIKYVTTSCTPSPDTLLCADRTVWRAANTAREQHATQPLYSQWSARSPAHGPSQASLADTALWLWPMRMRGHSGSEQVLYAYGPPHSIRDALVVFIAHLRRGRMVGVSCGRGGGEDFRAGLSEGCGQGEKRGRGRAEGLRAGRGGRFERGGASDLLHRLRLGGAATRAAGAARRVLALACGCGRHDPPEHVAPLARLPLRHNLRARLGDRRRGLRARARRRRRAAAGAAAGLAAAGAAARAAHDLAAELEAEQLLDGVGQLTRRAGRGHDLAWLGLGLRLGLGLGWG